MASSTDKLKLIDENFEDDEALHDDHMADFQPGASSTLSVIGKWNQYFDMWRSIEYNGLAMVVIGVITFSLTVTVALFTHILIGQPQVVPHAVVIGDDQHCTQLGLMLLRKNGMANAFDAATTIYLCMTVTRPDVASMASCGLILLHPDSTKRSDLVDGQCAASYSRSFTDVPDPLHLQSAGLPNFIHALYRMHRDNGGLAWNYVVQLAYDHVKEGFCVNQQLLFNIVKYDKKLAGMPKFYQEHLLSALAANASWRPSPSILKHLLALRDVTDEKELQAVYFGDYMKLDVGWSVEDQKMLAPINRTRDTVSEIFHNMKVTGFGLPSYTTSMTVGMLYGLRSFSHRDKDNDYATDAFYGNLTNLNLLAQTLITQNFTDEPQNTFTYRLNKTWREKFYNRRLSTDDLSQLYHPLPSDDSEGSTNTFVVDKYQNLVLISSTLGSVFGSGHVTDTGIILNNVLSQFVWNSTLYAPAAGKRPPTSMSPLLVYNAKQSCGPRFLVAGTRGLSSVSNLVQVLLNPLFLQVVDCNSDECLDVQLPPALHRLTPYIHVEQNNDKIYSTTHDGEEEPEESQAVFRSADNEVSNDTRRETFKVYLKADRNFSINIMNYLTQPDGYIPIATSTPESVVSIVGIVQHQLRYGSDSTNTNVILNF